MQVRNLTHGLDFLTGTVDEVCVFSGLIISNIVHALMIDGRLLNITHLVSVLTYQ